MKEPRTWGGALGRPPGRALGAAPRGGSGSGPRGGPPGRALGADPRAGPAPPWMSAAYNSGVDGAKMVCEACHGYAPLRYYTGITSPRALQGLKIQIWQSPQYCNAVLMDGFEHGTVFGTSVWLLLETEE